MSKRCMDLVLVLASAPVWVPLALVIALLVRWRIGKPVLFRQRRPGKDEVPFTLIKFRTMTQGLDREGRPLPDEERLTRLGRFLRTTSLDELPELLLVLSGKMSLVGPRPLLMEYLERYSTEQRRRHQVLPGITGLAQVEGRNALDWEERFGLDLYYVEHQSLWLDLRILWKTFFKVLRREGIASPGKATGQEFMGSLDKDGDERD